jgi:hypothetical protein
MPPQERSLPDTTRLISARQSPILPAELSACKSAWPTGWISTNNRDCLAGDYAVADSIESTAASGIRSEPRWRSSAAQGAAAADGRRKPMWPSRQNRRVVCKRTARALTRARLFMMMTTDLIRVAAVTALRGISARRVQPRERIDFWDSASVEACPHDTARPVENHRISRDLS